MAKMMSNLEFKLMETLGIPIRDLFMPPDKMLGQVEIRQGMQILDFGCGPGTFSIKLAEKTGPSGLVYALDIHPLALKTVQKKARKRNLENIRTILSDGSTSLADASLDLVVLLDVFHEIPNQDDILKELHRVLKADAVMCFSDHHMKEEQIMGKVAPDNGLFKLLKKGMKTYNFVKS